MWITRENEWRQVALMENVNAIRHQWGMSAEDRFPSDAADRFQVRMPPGLRQRLSEEAKANGRSMNSEIVARLQSSLDADSSSIENTELVVRAATEATSRIVRGIARAYAEASDKEKLDVFGLLQKGLSYKD